jgi:hypothetical protein
MKAQGGQAPSTKSRKFTVRLTLNGAGGPAKPCHREARYE